MTMIDVWVEIDGNRVAEALHEAGEKLDSAGGDVFLDFSSVHRIDPAACVRWKTSLARPTGKQ